MLLGKIGTNERKESNAGINKAAAAASVFASLLENSLPPNRIFFCHTIGLMKNDPWDKHVMDGTTTQVPVDDNPYGVHALFFSIVG